MPRRIITEQEKARRELAARLLLICACGVCAFVFLFSGVDYALSFRRETRGIMAKNDPPPVSPDESDYRMNINEASSAQLKSVPGIGEKLAERILTLRDERGGFRFLEELKDVDGVGDKRFADLQDYFFCPLP